MEDIDHINTHATSTPVGDISEVRAIANLLRNDNTFINKVSVTAIKSLFGHTFGAAGAIESIFAILSIANGKVPPILNLDNPIDEPKINYVTEINKS